MTDAVNDDLSLCHCQTPQLCDADGDVVVSSTSTSRRKCTSDRQTGRTNRPASGVKSADSDSRRDHTRTLSNNVHRAYYVIYVTLAAVK